MTIPVQGHVDTYLTDFSVDYYNNADRFVAGKVFPTVPVTEQTGLYVKWPKGYFLRDEMRERPLGERNRRAGYKTGSGRYTCIEEGLTTRIDDRERPKTNDPHVNPLDPDEAATRFLTGQALIHQERKFVATYMKPGVWSTDMSGVSSSPNGTSTFLQWDQAGSDPADFVAGLQDDMVEKGGLPGNTLTLGRLAYRRLRAHPAIKDSIKYVQKANVTLEILAEYLGVDRVFVPGGVQNTAAEGQTDAISYIVPKKAALLTYANPAERPSKTEPSAGYTFAWTGLIPGVTNAFGGVIERRRDDPAHSDEFEIRVAGDQEMVAPDLGVYLDAAVA
jgi:hypothetical protein